jgi:hypothetical protein
MRSTNSIAACILSTETSQFLLHRQLTAIFASKDPHNVES